MRRAPLPDAQRAGGAVVAQTEGAERLEAFQVGPAAGPAPFGLRVTKRRKSPGLEAGFAGRQLQPHAAAILQHRHWRSLADIEVGTPAGAFSSLLIPWPRHQGQRAAARGTRRSHRRQNFGSLRFMTGTSWSQASERSAAAA